MVEWKKLGDVCEVLNSQRRPVSKGNRRDGIYPYYGANGIQDYVENYLFDGTFLLLGEDGSVINKDKSPVLHWAIGKIWVNNHAHILKGIDNYSLRYIYYALQCVDVSDIVRGVPPKINQANMRNILIPVPSISEQNRIVGILDTFTASIENLKQQIAQRRKQFEFYRDQLLDLEGKPGVEMKRLGEIGKCMAGATPSTKKTEYWENGTISWMSSGEVHQGVVTHTASFITQKGYDNASTKMLPIGTVVIALAGQGKTRGTVAITAIELCTNQSLCGVVIDDEDILNKYVYYYLKTRYNDLRRVSSGDGTRGGLNLKMIGAYPIPLPPLSEQQHIVSILDTFEASISNLEAQLAQRQKQYEYYRNQLLTFE